MSYTSLDVSFEHEIDFGEGGCRFVEIETVIDVPDDWMVDEVINQNLLDDAQVINLASTYDVEENIANIWLDSLTEKELLELFAEKCGIDV